jgi:rSAM/selenodomain-associated transferase 1
MKVTAALMLKAPRPGTVKTRLAASMGSDRATMVYRNLVERQLASLPSDWQVVIHYSPENAASEMEAWLSPLAPAATFVPQVGGDLGDRMAEAVAQDLRAGADAVVLLGGDCPLLDLGVLKTVESHLQSFDLVIGPATDGGYVLLGLKSLHRELFDGIAWSTSRVLEQTLAASTGAGLCMQLLPPLEDIDDWPALERLHAELRTEITGNEPIWNVDQLTSPALVIDSEKMERNLRAMQTACDAAGVELWPHIKTHKMVPVLCRQLALGAMGATCAKVGEAEAMLPSGIRRIFIAHSLCDLRLASRLKDLAARLEVLMLAVTSEPHFPVLEALLAASDLRLPVLMAVDTGLGREGVRTPEEAARLASMIRQSSRMDLLGLYTHEGHAYSTSANETVEVLAANVHQQLLEFSTAANGELPIWPGCSVTAKALAGQPGVKAIRPGSYVFGDLFLCEITGVMSSADVALSVLATVIDRPERGLALIDAGSKVFSSDRAGGHAARCVEFPDLVVDRLSEEHGFVTGPGVNSLSLGQRLHFLPAHVCPVVNLASRVYAVRGHEVLDSWVVDARGRSD